MRGSDSFGDMPCWAMCANVHCNWNADGLCRDNATCENIIIKDKD